MCENLLNFELQRSISELDISEENDSPSGKRWDPVGANNGDNDFALEYKRGYSMESNCSEMDKLKILEEEQEVLNSSLIALTTHFAQVQFRLKQICDAPTNKKEELLKELEEFAFRGIPDVQSNFFLDAKSTSSSPSHGIMKFNTLDSKETDLKIEMQRNKQRELISQLKSQLEDLEKYAYETGNADLPSSIVLERQNLIINHLKEKLNFNVEDFSKLSAEDLRWQVDFAINQIVSPLKMKEQLITQLKTQITDLERFINYLQGEVSTETLACTCACPVHTSGPAQYCNTKKSFQKSTIYEHNSTSLSTFRKIISLLHIYIMSQLGCSSPGCQDRKKDTMHGWRDIRTRLDVAVEHVLETLAESEYCNNRSSIHEEMVYNSDSDSAANQYDVKVTLAVRKHLAICIRDLMQHGTTVDTTVNSVVPFVGCFAQKSYNSTSFMHAWEIILKYYEIKNGHRYNSSPAQKLSQSFNLDLNGGQIISSKQNLLVTIGNIITMHLPYKRSLDSNFKAFICAALNANKLVTWLKLILQCQYLLENYYMPWSYVIKTGFQDTFHTLDKLTRHKFDLPIDLAIQQFQNIKEAF